MPESSATPIRPEMEILLCVSRTSVAPETLARLRELVSLEIDWPWLLASSSDHGLFPLLYWHLNAGAADVVPPAWLDLLRDLFRQNAQRSLQLTSELIRVLSQLEKAGIVAVPYKGPVLASVAYGNLGLRRFVDLDVLVRHRDLARTQDVLLALGYKTVTGISPAPPGTPPRAPGQYAYSRAPERILLEVHTENTLRYFPRPPDFENLWGRLKNLELAGKQIRSLPEPDLFSFLSVHGTKHFWGRLGWVCDIAELARVQEPSGWPLVRERAVSYGAERIVALSLALAKDLLNVPLPEEIIAWVEADGSAARLAGRLRDQILSPELRPGVFGRFLFRVRMRPGLRDGFRYALRLATTPTEEDRAATLDSGPFAVAWLTSLRLLRLLRKYGLGFRPTPAAANLSRYEPTPPEIAGAMLEFAAVRPGDVLYDLGCGDGRIVIQAARQYGIRAIGVDIDPDRIAAARQNARKESVHDLVKFLRQDARAVDLSEATVVMLYLPWAANLSLRETLRRRLRPGARVVSRNSGMGDWLPEKTEVARDSAGALNTLLLWRI